MSGRAGVFAAVAVLASLAFLTPALAGVDFTTQAVQVTETSAGDYSFSEGGFSDGASITGTFSGVDSNGDGQISYFTNPPEPAYPLEVTGFAMNFSGNAFVPAFSLTFSQLDNFNYQLGPTLGSSTTILNGLTEGIEAGSTNRFYIAGPGPAALCNGSEICAGVLATPEPADWVLLSSGVFAVGAAVRATPRRLKQSLG